jgi:hypothetical protein
MGEREQSISSLSALGQLLAGLPPDPDLDWDAVASLAGRHGVAPLLFWKLYQEAGGREKMSPAPAAVRGRLQRDYYGAVALGLVAERELVELLRALTAAGVTVLVLKGAGVAAFYPDRGLRCYGDVDLLVPQAQVDRAEEVLGRLGYRYSQSRDWYTEHFNHLPPMRSDEGALAVELHWRLDHGETICSLPVEGMWARAVPWTVGDQPALRLEDVDMVLYLSRHAVVQHRTRLGLRPLCDLMQVTQGWGRAEWETLTQRAAEYGLGRPVYLMLALAQQMLDLAPPAEVMSGLRPSSGALLPGDLGEWLIRNGDGHATPVPRAVVQARAQGSVGARLRHVLWHLFLPRKGMSVIYGVPANSPRIWLTYMWRPVHLLRRYGRSSWDALRRESAAQAAWQREAWLDEWLRADEPQYGAKG